MPNLPDFGLTPEVQTHTPCLRFYVTVDPICPHPDRHLFWDAIHPTAAGHEAVEEAAERALHSPRSAD